MINDKVRANFEVEALSFIEAEVVRIHAYWVAIGALERIPDQRIIVI